MALLKTKNFELAVYTKGNSKSSKLAIVIPGRLDTKDYVHNTILVDYLADNGYLALSFDAPGIWESFGGIELYTITNCLKAVNELIEYFGNKPTVLSGHSNGGTIAMLVGPNNPHVTHIISIFSHYGISDKPEEKRIINGAVISYRDLPPGTERTEKKKKFELPLGYFEDGAQYNALPGLKKCHKPKLFLYGTRDALIGPEGVKKAFKESATPKFIQAVDSEHDYRLSPHIIEEINQKIGEFLFSTDN
ncbi:alpha/beta fold hydrolase [Candidatus Wolfebacteria bacterium]|nr:alpha/beta fold hydrolase [Candidatus Wolfebacteria bacterium]